MPLVDSVNGTLRLKRSNTGTRESLVVATSGESKGNQMTLKSVVRDMSEERLDDASDRWKRVEVVRQAKEQFDLLEPHERAELLAGLQRADEAATFLVRMPWERTNTKPLGMKVK